MGAINGYYTRDGMIDVCVMISPRDRKQMRQIWAKLTRLEKLNMQFCIDDFSGEYRIHKPARIAGYSRKEQWTLREELKKEQQESVKNGTYAKRWKKGA